MENVSSVQNTILKAVVNSLKLFYAHLNARNLVVSDGWWPLTVDFPAGRKGAERLLPLWVRWRLKTCSLSLCGDAFPRSAARRRETLKNLNVWCLCSILTGIETAQWAQEVLVRSDGQAPTCVCPCAYASLPPSLSNCRILISLGNQAGKKPRSGGRSSAVLLSSSEGSERLSGCRERCARCRSPRRRKADIVLERMRSRRRAEVMCCVS